MLEILARACAARAILEVAPDRRPRAHDPDPSLRGVRAFFDARAALPRRATAVQTVGSKGYDGFALVRVGG